MNEQRQSKKLEDIAKAYASGILDESSYREQRARIIDTCQYDLDDETQPQLHQFNKNEESELDRHERQKSHALMWRRVLMVVTVVAATLAVVLLTRLK